MVSNIRKAFVFTLVAAIVAFNLAADTYQGLTYSSSGDIVPGEWTSQFSKAKSYADSHKIPLVVLWGNDGCGYCDSLIKAMSSASAVSWARQRKYVFVLAHGTSGESGKARTFVDMSGGFPFCRAVWKATSAAATSYEISYKFHGRDGQMQCDWSSSLAKQFADSVDYYVGGYAGVYPVEGTADPTKGGTVSGHGIYASGATAKLTAKVKSGYYFAGWYLGGTKVSTSASYQVAVEDKAVKLTAKFVSSAKDYLEIDCKVADSYLTKATMSPVTLSVKSESVAKVKVSGLPKGVSYDDTTRQISGTPSKSGVYSLTIEGKTQSGVTEKITREMVVKAADERRLVLSCLQGTGSVSGGGVYKVGAKVKVTAKAAKGWAFSGWLLKSVDGSKLSASAKYVYVMPDEDAELEGSFVTKDDDAGSIALKIDGETVDAAIPLELTAYAGVRASYPVVASALTATQVKVSGLPSGLKLVTDKSTGAISIAGVATKGSKIDSSTGKAIASSVKVGVSTGAGNRATFKLSIVVIALPTWAYGTFNGGSDDGMFTLSISSAGKASGKWLSGGRTWSLSAASFAELDESGCYALDLVGKNGKNLQTNRYWVCECEVGESTIGGIETEGHDFMAAQNLWKLSPWKALSATMAKAPQLDYAVEAPTDKVSLKFGKSGAVTTRGVFGTYKVSGSATLIIVGENAFDACIYFPPKSGKFDGYCELLRLNWDGAKFSLAE